MRKDKGIQISCLSSKETCEITKYATSIDNCRFMIPFTSHTQIELLEKLKNLLPFKYIIYDREIHITSLEYTVINDYIILQFVK